MILFILGITALVVCAVQVYKTAVGTGRAPLPWTLLTVGVGFFLQIILPFIIGIFLGLYLLLTGTPADQLQEASSWGLVSIINIACLVFSVAAMIFIMNLAGRIPDEPPVSSHQHPPQQF